MASRLRVEHLVWDDWNRAHIARHGVMPEEAEEVIVGDPLVRATYKGRFVFLGPTIMTRMLAVIIGPVPGQIDTYYVFTARPASRRERRFYQEQTGAAPDA